MSDGISLVEWQPVQCDHMYRSPFGKSCSCTAIHFKHSCRNLKKNIPQYAYRAESLIRKRAKQKAIVHILAELIDPETKLIIAKEESGKRTKLGKAVDPINNNVASPDVSRVIAQQRDQIASLQQQFLEMNERNLSLLHSLARIRDSIDSFIKG